MESGNDVTESGSDGNSRSDEHIVRTNSNSGSDTDLRERDSSTELATTQLISSENICTKNSVTDLPDNLSVVSEQTIRTESCKDNVKCDFVKVQSIGEWLRRISDGELADPKVIPLCYCSKTPKQCMDDLLKKPHR